MMDIKSLALTTAATFIHFDHPATGKPIENEKGEAVGVMFYGPGTKENRVAHKRQIDAQLAKGKRAKDITADLLESNRVDVLAECTAGFCGFNYNGKEFSAETAKEFYADPTMLHFREQVEKVAGEFADFLQTV